MALLDEVLDAHGGAGRWRAARRISARVRSGGLLIRTRVPGNRFADYRVTVSVAEPRAVLDPFPGPGRRGVFERGAVRIEDADGEPLATRSDPRPCFFGRPGLRRNLRWDPLDATYFAGYAMWNYLTTPLLLAREGVEVEEVEPLRRGGERRLVARFPAGLDTHCREQGFHFDSRLRLCRHDYVAEVVGGWARAAHECAEHASAGGLLFPTRRAVRPAGPGGRVVPLPVLVSLRLSELEVEAG